MTAAEPVDLAERLVTVARPRAVRQLAAILVNDAHHVIASTPAAAARDTAKRLEAVPAVWFFGDDRSLDVAKLAAPSGLDEALQDALAGLEPRHYALTVIAHTAATPAQLADVLGASLDPSGALPRPLLRRPDEYPNVPPRLLREALARLAAHQGAHHR